MQRRTMDRQTNGFLVLSIALIPFQWFHLIIGEDIVLVVYLDCLPLLDFLACDRKGFNIQR